MARLRYALRVAGRWLRSDYPLLDSTPPLPWERGGEWDT